MHLFNKMIHTVARLNIHKPGYDCFKEENAPSCSLCKIWVNCTRMNEPPSAHVQLSHIAQGAIGSVFLTVPIAL